MIRFSLPVVLLVAFLFALMGVLVANPDNQTEINQYIRSYAEFCEA